MKKAPKVLTRMRLSCCWGDNLDEKELNDIVDYIDELEQQCKKQQEVIDKINLIIKGVAYGGSEDYYMEKFSKINELIKEVSE